MGTVNLPKTSQTGSNEWADVQDNDEAIVAQVNGQLDDDNIDSLSGTKLTDGTTPLAKLVSGTSAQIPVANGSGVPVWKSLSGDGTISNTGVLSLSNTVVQSGEIANPNAALSITSSLQDVPSVTIGVTPTVASIAIVTTTFDFTGGTGDLYGYLDVDGSLASSGRGARAKFVTGMSGGVITVSQTYRVALTAASHTLKLRTRDPGGTPSGCTCSAAVLSYTLHRS